MQKGDLIQARVTDDGELKYSVKYSVQGAFGIIIKKNDEHCAPFADVYDVLWNDGAVTEHWENDLEKVT